MFIAVARRGAVICAVGEVLKVKLSRRLLLKGYEQAHSCTSQSVRGMHRGPAGFRTGRSDFQRSQRPAAPRGQLPYLETGVSGDYHRALQNINVPGRYF